MTRYLIKRIAQNILVFFTFLTLVFFLLDAQPGDFGSAFTNDPRLTAEQRQQIKKRLGLDKPASERYFIWMGNFLRGDFGVSFSNSQRDVLDVIKERAPRTITLFLSATIVSFYFGFLSGKLLAWRRGGPFEYVATLGGVFLFTVFTPWFGLMMLWIFANVLDIFPGNSFITVQVWSDVPDGITVNLVFSQILSTGLIASVVLFIAFLLTQNLEISRRKLYRWGATGLVFISIIVYWLLFSSQTIRYALDIIWHLMLPIITLGLVSFAGTMLLTRNSMLETLREDYILTAKAKGLPEKVVRDKHAARNAMLPVVTSFVFSLAAALDGGIITETIFSWPGMGLTLLNAARTEDIPMAIGTLVFIGILALTAHLVADILYAYLDPRIRYN